MMADTDSCCWGVRPSIVLMLMLTVCSCSFSFLSSASASISASASVFGSCKEHISYSTPA